MVTEDACNFSIEDLNDIFLIKLTAFFQTPDQHAPILWRSSFVSSLTKCLAAG